MFTVLAVIGLVMGSVSVQAMPQVDNAMHDSMASHMTGAVGDAVDDKCHHAEGMSHPHNTSVMADDMSNDCSAASVDEPCDMGGNCCSHCVTALPLQLDVSFPPLPVVQTATPQWRVSSVTPVTEIRPPIFTL